MKTSETIEAISAALAEAQGQLTAPSKNKVAKIPMKTGGNYSYNYADLAEIIEHCKPTLQKNGLALIQVIGYQTFGSEERQIGIFTRLTHKSGQWLEGFMPLPVHEGMKPQEVGSLITYYRRYAWTGMVGIVADEDDDGQAAQNAQPKAKPAPPKVASKTAQEILGQRSRDDTAYRIPFAGGFKDKTLTEVPKEALEEYAMKIEKTVQDGKVDKKLMPQIEEFFAKVNDHLNLASAGNIPY